MAPHEVFDENRRFYGYNFAGYRYEGIMRHQSEVMKKIRVGAQHRHVLPLTVLALITLLAAGTSYRYGYDWGDMGSYASIVYELLHGAKPGEFVAYGPLWYLPGSLLFWFYGVDYVALLAMFVVLIFLSAVLLYFATYEATRNLFAAFLTGFLFIAVPPFFPSVVRSLSLGLFLLPLIMLARAEPEKITRALIWTSIAVGLNFQLRPDFGYVYLALLIAVLGLRAFYDANTNAKRLTQFCRSSGIALAVVSVTLVPLLLHAVWSGYFWLVLDDLLSYPRRILFFVMSAGGLGDMLGASSDRQKATFLRILPASAIFGPNASDREFAFLIYSTLLVLVVSGTYLLHNWLRSVSQRPNLMQMAVFAVVALQWPIFALFRPDWVHFISFMHGYIVGAACIAFASIGVYRNSIGATRAVAASIVALLAVQSLVFVKHGEGPGSIGWLALRQGRTQEFTAGNGVSVRVSPAERSIYRKIDRVIRASSQPDDRIVCVPYCAGFAFMSERRMLFKQQYVDDGTPAMYPDWIDKAIEATAAARTPVIIVLDWAPNGTDVSNFNVWASRYMDFVRKNYPVAVPIGMGTIWLKTAPKIEAVTPAATVAKVTGYGPTGTTAGKPFNVQPDGRSALWMHLSVEVSPFAKIYLDDKPLATNVNGTAVSAIIPSEAFATPGEHALRVTDTEDNITTEPVPFVVRAP